MLYLQKYFLIVFVLLTHVLIHSQSRLHDSKWDLQLGVSGGKSTISGYSTHLEIGAEKKVNSFRFVLGTQSQIGNKATGLIFPVFYNDKFHSSEIMYGRRFIFKKFLAEMDAGVTGYIYRNKSLIRVPGYLTTNQSEIKTTSGIGFIGSSSIGVIINDNTILAIEGNVYLTYDITLFTLGIKWVIIG